MLRCPYGPHRLILKEGTSACRCGGDLAAWVAACDLPIWLYNRSRRLWEDGCLPAAAAGLGIVLELRPELAEAHWLLAAIAARQGEPDRARFHLARAEELGAPVDLEWLAGGAP